MASESEGAFGDYTPVFLAPGADAEANSLGLIDGDLVTPAGGARSGYLPVSRRSAPRGRRRRPWPWRTGVFLALSAASVGALAVAVGGNYLRRTAVIKRVDGFVEEDSWTGGVAVHGLTVTNAQQAAAGSATPEAASRSVQDAVGSVSGKIDGFFRGISSSMPWSSSRSQEQASFMAADPEWEVVIPWALVHEEAAAPSSIIGRKVQGSLVVGEREGRWLRLIDEPGYMLIVDDTSIGEQTLLRRRHAFFVRIDSGPCSAGNYGDILDDFTCNAAAIAIPGIVKAEFSPSGGCYVPNTAWHLCCLITCPLRPTTVTSTTTWTTTATTITTTVTSTSTTATSTTTSITTVSSTTTSTTTVTSSTTSTTTATSTTTSTNTATSTTTSTTTATSTATSTTTTSTTTATSTLTSTTTSTTSTTTSTHTSTTTSSTTSTATTTTATSTTTTTATVTLTTATSTATTSTATTSTVTGTTATSTTATTVAPAAYGPLLAAEAVVMEETAKAVARAPRGPAAASASVAEADGNFDQPPHEVTATSTTTTAITTPSVKDAPAWVKRAMDFSLDMRVKADEEAREKRLAAEARAKQLAQKTRLTRISTTLTPSANQVPSILCFLVFRVNTTELALIRAAYRHGWSIFSCNQWHAFSDQPVLLGGKDRAIPVPGPPAVYHKLWLNTDVLFRAWKKIFELRTFLRHEWTVKVDPDVVFIAWRLRQHLKGHNGWTDAVYFKNCGLYHSINGPLEVFSKPAVVRLKSERWKCDKQLDASSLPEDQYSGRCMDILHAKAIFNGYLLVDENCGGEATTCDRRTWNHPQPAAFHPFKDLDGYTACIAKTTDK